MFWQSVLDIPYRVLIYAISAIVMVGHVHILFWVQYEIHCFMYKELLKYGSSTWTEQYTLVVLLAVLQAVLWAVQLQAMWFG